MLLARRLTLFAAFALAAAPVLAEDWPNLRGPNGDGVSPESGLTTDWNGNARVLWSADVGVGYASFAVADGRAYTAGWANGKDTVHCFDADSGEKLWAYSYPAERMNEFNEGGPSTTPTVSDGKVFTISKDGQMHAFDAETGRVLWKKNLEKDLGGKRPRWGYSGSVTADDGEILVDAGPLYALDPATGRTIWKSAKMDVGYGTPVVFERGGKRYIAIFNAHGLVILERKGGGRVTDYRWKTRYEVNAATPLVHGDHIFISSGYGKGAALLTFDGRSLEVVWETRKMRNQMNPSILFDGHLYGFDGNAGSRTKFNCLDAKTGEVVWSHEGLGTASLIGYGDGGLVILSDDGRLVLAEATPEGYRPTVEAKVFGDTSWTTPVLSNGRIYCRNAKGKIVCVDVNPGAA